MERNEFMVHFTNGPEAGKVRPMRLPEDVSRLEIARVAIGNRMLNVRGADALREDTYIVDHREGNDIYLRLDDGNEG